MPPAFNLSQDQTLKFNLSHILKSNKLTVECLIFASKPRRTRPHQPSTHTYRLFKFLKNTAAPAAKREDSDRHTAHRQAPAEHLTPPPKPPPPYPLRPANPPKNRPAAKE